MQVFLNLTMVKRVHTRKRRYMPDKKGRCRAKRPKSFSSEASARAWAAKMGIKSFELKNFKNPECKEKKIIIITKQ